MVPVGVRAAVFFSTIIVSRFRPDRRFSLFQFFCFVLFVLLFCLRNIRATRYAYTGRRASPPGGMKKKNRPVTATGTGDRRMYYAYNVRV